MWIQCLTVLTATGAVALAPSLQSQQSHARVSVDTQGLEGNHESRDAVVSGDGRIVAFMSKATNLVADDTNGFIDVFTHDRQTGKTERISMGLNGDEADRDAVLGSLAISRDGRFVAFASKATNLVVRDTNRAVDVFVADAWHGTIRRASLGNGGAQSPRGGGGPDLSSDGQRVSFTSKDSGLVNGDTNGKQDVFVHDLGTNETIRVSVGSAGQEGNQGSQFGRISGDGNSVVFLSASSTFMALTNSGTNDAFLRDIALESTVLISVNDLGENSAISLGTMPSWISESGDRVLFSSRGGNYQASNDYHVFLRDRNQGTTSIVSLNSQGVEGDGSSREGELSEDGRWLSFDSSANNMVSQTTGKWGDAFLRDMHTGETICVALEEGLIGGADGVRISEDGSTIVFQTQTRDFSPEKKSAFWDVYSYSVEGLSLTRRLPRPGVVKFMLSGSHKGNKCALVWGYPGSFVLPPSMSCSGLELDLIPLGFPGRGYLSVFTRDRGRVRFPVQLQPWWPIWDLRVQVIDLTACELSNFLSVH
jgi:hypothetical protein